MMISFLLVLQMFTVIVLYYLALAFLIASVRVGIGDGPKLRGMLYLTLVPLLILVAEMIYSIGVPVL